ncbi:MAG: hypothetical protein M9954_15220, partial [Cyclobacteriaceae bacterium]|nr:hypothetical protein [Cyclobacteriaceae bacterium]
MLSLPSAARIIGIGSWITMKAPPPGHCTTLANGLGAGQMLSYQILQHPLCLLRLQPGAKLG